MSQEAMVQFLNEAAEGGGIQGVIRTGTPLGGGDEAFVGQEVHVMRDGGRGQAQFFGDVLAVALPGFQGAENFQPAFVANGFEPTHQAQVFEENPGAMSRIYTALDIQRCIYYSVRRRQNRMKGARLVSMRAHGGDCMKFSSKAKKCGLSPMQLLLGDLPGLAGCQLPENLLLCLLVIAGFNAGRHGENALRPIDGGGGIVTQGQLLPHMQKQLAGEAPAKDGVQNHQRRKSGLHNCG